MWYELWLNFCKFLEFLLAIAIVVVIVGVATIVIGQYIPDIPSKSAIESESPLFEEYDTTVHKMNGHSFIIVRSGAGVGITHDPDCECGYGKGPRN